MLKCLGPVLEVKQLLSWSSETRVLIFLFLIQCITWKQSICLWRHHSVRIFVNSFFWTVSRFFTGGRYIAICFTTHW